MERLKQLYKLLYANSKNPLSKYYTKHRGSIAQIHKDYEAPLTRCLHNVQ